MIRLLCSLYGLLILALPVLFHRLCTQGIVELKHIGSMELPADVKGVLVPGKGLEQIFYSAIYWTALFGAVFLCIKLTYLGWISRNPKGRRDRLPWMAISSAFSTPLAGGLTRQIPGILVAVGLLGTFVGLTEALGKMGQILQETGGVDDKIVGDLKVALESMALQFKTSVWGIAYSLVFRGALSLYDFITGRMKGTWDREMESALGQSELAQIVQHSDSLVAGLKDVRSVLGGKKFDADSDSEVQEGARTAESSGRELPPAETAVPEDAGGPVTPEDERQDHEGSTDLDHSILGIMQRVLEGKLDDSLTAISQAAGLLKATTAQFADDVEKVMKDAADANQKAAAEIVKAADSIADKTEAGLENFTDSMKRVIGDLQDSNESSKAALADAAEAIAARAESELQHFTSSVESAIGALRESSQESTANLADAAESIAEKTGSELHNFTRSVEGAIRGLQESNELSKGVLTEAAGGIKGATEGIAEHLGDTMESMKSKIGKALESMGADIGGALAKIEKPVELLVSLETKSNTLVKRLESTLEKLTNELELQRKLSNELRSASAQKSMQESLAKSSEEPTDKTRSHSRLGNRTGGNRASPSSSKSPGKRF